MNEFSKDQTPSSPNTENVSMVNDKSIPEFTTTNDQTLRDRGSFSKGTLDEYACKPASNDIDSEVGPHRQQCELYDPLQTAPDEAEDQNKEQQKLIHPNKPRKWPLKSKRRDSPQMSTAIFMDESPYEEDEDNEDQATEGDDFDYDDDFEEAESYELFEFDFECLTKPTKAKLTVNQLDYKRFCKQGGLVPNAHIVRSLTETSMTLNSQQMGPRGIKALCAVLSSNCFVTTLEISEDVIDLRTMANICELCMDNHFITDLNLSNNKMGRVAVKMLIDAIEYYDKLVYLNLSGNCLEDSDGGIFVKYIKNTTKLASLDLSYNNFRDEAATLLGKALIANGSIVDLSLRWNHIRGAGAKGLLAGMFKNRSVETLDLSWNGLGGEGVKYLCQMLRKNSVILTLDISGNRLNLSEMLEIFASIKKARSILTLLIGNNLMSERHIAEFLQEIVQFKGQFTLKNLHFGNSLIDFHTVPLVNKCRQEKDLMITHGPVFGMKEKAVNDADELASLNPVTVLMNFGHVLGMSVRELFDYMDADGSQTLSRQEIKDGLMEFDLPLPENSLDLLIRKMDSDGDGEISINDLLSTGQQQRVSKQDTETARCRKILKRLMAANKMSNALKEKTRYSRCSRSNTQSQSKLALASSTDNIDMATSEDDAPDEKHWSKHKNSGISQNPDSFLPPIAATNGIASSVDHD